MAKFRAAVLTGGGDTPALNSTIWGITRAAEERGGEVIGLLRGWAGALQPDGEYTIGGKRLHEPTGEYVYLTSYPERASRTLQYVDPTQGGTIIKTSRTNLAKAPETLEDVAARLNQLNVDFFLPTGGEDTHFVTLLLVRNGMLGRMMVTAVPKTIDNDVGIVGMSGAFEDMVNIWTPGFPTAVSNGRNYCDVTYSTAYSHERVMFVEAMGRKAGFLALGVGDRSKADMILIPEDPVFIEGTCQMAVDIYRQKGFFYCVVSEGVINAETGREIGRDDSLVDRFGHAKLGGAAKILAKAAEARFKADGIFAPYFNGQVPEYVFRGGPPTRLDRETAQRLGHYAMTNIIDHPGANGHMAVLRWANGGAVPQSMPLEQAVTIWDGKIVPRSVPVDRKDPEKGFYDPATKNITALGRAYAALLQIPELQFEPLKAIVYR